MKYDLSQIELIVSERKRKFKTAIAIVALLFLVFSLMIALWHENNKIVFLCGLADILLIFAFVRVLSIFSPAILFSKEVRGENILEDEYVLLTRKRGFKLGKYSPLAIPTRRATSEGREKIRAGVYLRLENGDIYSIRDLSVAHTSLYEIGDILYKPAGVKYPIIEGKDVKAQPCPLCGQINNKGARECRCGVNIFN